MSAPKKFDFIIPIGTLCMTSYNLRQNKKQRESLPFDWLWVDDMQSLIKLIATHFEGFIKKENLQFKKNNGDADVYRDPVTHTEFWHDFMFGHDFNEDYDLNVKKYQRRIKRLYFHIEHAQKVLWVRMVKIFPNKERKSDDLPFENAQFEPQQVKDDLAALQNLYPQKKFELLLFYLYDSPHQTTEYDLTPNIHICEMNNDEKLGWKGNMSTIAEILQKYDLTLSAKIYYDLNSLKHKLYKLYLQITGFLGNKNNKKLSKQRD